MPIKLLVTQVIVGGSALSVYLFSVFFVLVAEEASSTSPLTAIGALVAGFTGMLALMAWVLKYLLSTTIPNMLINFQQSMDRQRDAFERSISEQQKLFTDSAKIFQEIVAKAQDDYKADLKSMHDIFFEEKEKARLLFENQMKSEREFFSKELEEIMAEFRIDRERFFDSLVDDKGIEKS